MTGRAPGEAIGVGSTGRTHDRHRLKAGRAGNTYKGEWIGEGY